jgi:hypothetical protein
VSVSKTRSVFAGKFPIKFNYKNHRVIWIPNPKVGGQLKRMYETGNPKRKPSPAEQE